MSKVHLITDIARLAGIPDPGVGVGSSVPKSLFDDLCRRFQLDGQGTMPEQAERIIKAAGMPYAQTYFDSRHTPSGGGSTVTESGLLQIKTAVQRLIDFER